jgi:hypothetical protein
MKQANKNVSTRVSGRGLRLTQKFVSQAVPQAVVHWFLQSTPSSAPISTLIITASGYASNRLAIACSRFHPVNTVPKHCVMQPNVLHTAAVNTTRHVIQLSRAMQLRLAAAPGYWWAHKHDHSASCAQPSHGTGLHLREPPGRSKQSGVQHRQPSGKAAVAAAAAPQTDAAAQSAAKQKCHRTQDARVFNYKHSS